MRISRVGTLAALVCLPFALPLQGCGEEKNGDADATIAFWKGVHQPYGDDESRRVFARLIPVSPDPQSQAFILKLMQELNAAKKANYERIAALPLTGVDEDAQAYALQVVKVEQETAVFIDSLSQLLQNPSGLPDLDQAVVDYFISVLQNLAGNGNPFWEAAKEQGAEKAEDVSSTQAKGRALKRQGESLGARVEALTTLQMETRVKLTKRYSQEFPASVPSAAPPVNLPGGDAASPRSVAKLKQDLMGREIGQYGSPWPVEALEEFQTFKVTGSLGLQRHALVDVATHVKGIHLGTEHDFKLRLVYVKGDEGWNLALAQQR